MAKNDGGSAFPIWTQDLLVDMSLRDWFAGQALAGMIIRNETTLGTMTAEAWSKLCYQLADAMLVERETDVN